MTFLPIVDRELRVASRKAGTYWTRALAALLVLVIVGGVLLIGQAARGAFANQIGTILFNILKWLLFISVAASGVLLTADCLSEEKREGTLGLLFLTDLRGYDVVLGKLLAMSLRAAYGLLAVFPITALVFLMGGVSGSEFRRLALVLCNTLFFSLALGVLVSSLSRDGLKAMTGTLVLGCCFFLLLPALDEAVAELRHRPSVPFFALASPSFGAIQTGRGWPGDVWMSLALVHGLAWGFLALASFCAPRLWQQKTASSAIRRLAKPSPRQTAQRTKELDRNPVGWLAGRERWLAGAVRVLVFGGAGLFVALSLGDGFHGGQLFGVGMVVFYTLAVFFKLWVAAQASRFFTESRRTGLLELLLATPVSGAEIVQGHWQALRRLFLLPAIVLLGLLVTCSVFQIAMMGGFTAPANRQIMVYQMISQAFGLITFVTGLWAVAWFGMWMGLTSRTAMVAVIKTLVFVKVLPSIGLAFAQGMLMVTTGLITSRFLNGGLWIASVITGLLATGTDIAFVVISRRKVAQNFRIYAAQASGPVSLPPPVVPPSGPRQPDPPLWSNEEGSTEARIPTP